MSATIKLPELPLAEQILTASDVATGWDLHTSCPRWLTPVPDALSVPMVVWS